MPAPGNSTAENNGPRGKVRHHQEKKVPGKFNDVHAQSSLEILPAPSSMTTSQVFKSEKWACSTVRAQKRTAAKATPTVAVENKKRRLFPGRRCVELRLFPFGPLWVPQVQGDIRVIIRKTSRLFEKAASEDRKGDGVPRVSSISPPRSGGRAFSRYYSSTVGRQQQQMIQKSRKAVESSHAVTNGEGGAVKRKGGMSNRRTVLFACVRCLVARTEPQLPGPANSMRRFSAMTHPPGGIATFIDIC